MAVDGVGKPPLPGITGPVASIGHSEPPAKAEFCVQAPDKASQGTEVTSVDSDLLNRLATGQVTQEQYLDIKAEQAVAHLAGLLPAHQIELIRTTLRDQLSNDPLFERLVRQVVSPAGQH